MRQPPEHYDASKMSYFFLVLSDNTGKRWTAKRFCRDQLRESLRFLFWQFIYITQNALLVIKSHALYQSK